MSYDLNGAADFLGADDAPISAAPFTMACWFWWDSSAATDDILWIGDKDVADHHWSLISVQTSLVLRLRAPAGGSAASASTSNTITAGAWQHGVGIITSATDRRSVLNGDWANSGTNVTSREPANTDRIEIGRRGDSTPSNEFNGKIGETAIWNVALNQAEIEALAAKAEPRSIRPASLIRYWQMIGTNLVDLMNGIVLTNSGGTISAHPPIAYLNSPPSALVPSGSATVNITGVVASADAVGLPGSIESQIDTTVTGVVATAGAAGVAGTVTSLAITSSVVIDTLVAGARGLRTRVDPAVSIREGS